jgi:hypothetical protein
LIHFEFYFVIPMPNPLSISALIKNPFFMLA